jgi:hypothetical protein
LRSTLPLPNALLLNLENPNDSTGQNDTWEGRRIMNHHDVERIAVIGFG